MTKDEENTIPSFLASPVMDMKNLSIADPVFDPTVTSSPSPSKCNYLFSLMYNILLILGYWPPPSAMSYGSTNYSYSPMANHYYSTYGSPTTTSMYPSYPLSYSPYPSFY